MIRKAIIKEINNDIFLVRIPDFESPGDNSEFLVEAVLCYQPGNLEGYFINDIVFVAFEQNLIEEPVIIGKLYKGKDEVATNYSNNQSLNVTGKTILSSDTTIGQLTYSDLYDMYKKLEEWLPIIESNDLTINKLITNEQ